MKDINTLLNQPIGQVVANYPSLVTIFMDHQVDFCCGGDRTLQEAIEVDSKEAEKVIKDLNDAIVSKKEAGEGKLTALSNEELIDHIVDKHHQYLRETLPRLDALLFKLLNVHSGNHPELFSLHKLFGTLKNELEAHMVKEEQDLFPRMLRKERDLQSLLVDLENEHDAAGDLLHEMTEVTHHFKVPKDACTTYEVTYKTLQDLVADMYMHVHTENNILFKR